MALKPLNSVAGYSVGEVTIANIILANGDITTNNITATGVSNLGNVANIVITGGSANYILKTDGSGNLSWTAPAASSSALTVYESNANAGNISNTTANVSGLLFDKDSGFSVSNVGNGNVLISLGSTFKTWIVDGQANLVAQGEDEVQFIAGNNLIITTSNVPNPPSQLYKYIRFDADVQYISNGNSNVSIPAANGNINFSAVGNANVLVVTGTGVNVSGTLNASGNANVGNIGVQLVTANSLISNRSNVSVTTNTLLDEFSPSTYRTAKYTISASSDDGYQSVETLLVHDGTNSYITIYGSICSNVSSDIIDISSNINGTSGNVTLYATSVSANTLVKVITMYLNT